MLTINITVVTIVVCICVKGNTYLYSKTTTIYQNGRLLLQSSDRQRFIVTLVCYRIAVNVYNFNLAGMFMRKIFTCKIAYFTDWPLHC